MIGGPQGSGVETAANIFSAVCAANGCHIFGKREYHSNIKGLHSYFVIRASEDLIRSNVSGVDFMASYDAETIFRHSSSVKPGGTILYDSKLKDVAASDVPTLDEPSLQILQERYGLEDVRVQNVLESAKTANVNLYPVSFRQILDILQRILIIQKLPASLGVAHLMIFQHDAGCFHNEYQCFIGGHTVPKSARNACSMRGIQILD